MFFIDFIYFVYYTRDGLVDIIDVLEPVIVKNTTYKEIIDNIYDSATYITLANGVRLTIKDSHENHL